MTVIPEKLSGDTETIRHFAQVYERTASALRDAAKELLELANNDVSISLAIDEVREKAQDAHSGTVKVATRYEGASQTYYAYERELKDAQDKANRARSMIANNSTDGAYWRNRRIHLMAQALLITPDDDFVKDLKEANDKVKQYDADFASAMHLYNEAVEDKRRAVVAAINGLDDAAHNSGLNDGFWESVAGQYQELYSLAQKYLGPVLKELRGILEIIKSIVDIISLIVSIAAIFLPFLAPLAAALVLASLALAAMIFLCSLALVALGKESLGRVLGDLINVAVGVVTAKLGGLKLGSLSGLASNVEHIGATVTKLGWQEGLQQGKLIFEVFPLKTALGSRVLDVAIDQGKGTLVGLGGDVLTFATDKLDAAITPGGQPWGADARADPSLSAAAVDSLAGAATGGITNSISGFGDGVDDVSSALNDQAQNANDFLAVTSR